jgi:hypothetical protein
MKNEISKTFERTNDGLRDALMSEMEDIRAGVATPDEAHAFAELAEKVIRSFEADIIVEKLNDDRKREEYERNEKVRKREVKRLRLEKELNQITYIQSYENDAAS